MWIGPLFLDFHLHFWSHLTWFSLKRPLNGLFDFADIPTWCFLHAMTHWCGGNRATLLVFETGDAFRNPGILDRSPQESMLRINTVQGCLCSSLPIHLAGHFPLQVQGTGTSLAKVMEKKKMQNCVFMEKNVWIGLSQRIHSQTPSTWPDKRCAWSKMSDSQDIV